MLTGASQTALEMRTRLARLLGEAGVPEPARDPGALLYLRDVIYAQANTMGFQDAYFLLAVFAVAGLVPAWVLSRAAKRRHGAR